jgi:hypothetical protein
MVWFRNWHPLARQWKRNLRKIGEARTILSEKMEGVFAQQQKDNQEFQRELILGNQAFQANMFNMFVTTQQDTVNYINESHKGINKLS